MNHTAVVTLYHRLSELPNTVHAFMGQQGEQNLFLSEEWFDLILRHTASDAGALRIYVVTNSSSGAVDGVLVGVGGRGRMWFARHQLSGLTNFYTMNFGIMLGSDVGRWQETARAIATTIAHERPRWDAVELRYLNSGDSNIKLLAEEFRLVGFVPQIYFQFKNWYLRTNGMTADDYFSSRPSQLRNTVVRKERRLRREHGVKFQLFQTPNDLSRGLEDYQVVYAASWKEPELYPEFIPEFLRYCAKRGALRLGLLYVDETPAAAQIWLLAGKRATIYKLAYDERYTSLSVGSILTKSMFDNILASDRVSEVDFGHGDEPYKHDWMSDRRDIMGMIAFNRGTAAGFCGMVQGNAKNFVRRIIGSNLVKRRSSDYPTPTKPV